MEQQETIPNNSIPTEKVYKDKEVWVGTFLGGPLVAGYLMAKNFKTFGEADKARTTWIIAIIATIFIFGISFLAPFIDRLPGFVLPLLYTGIAFVLTQMYQGEKIKAHLRAGGRIHSWWKTLGVTIIGIIVTLIPFVGTTFLLESIENANITVKNYGAVRHEISFDKTNITENEVDALAEGFEKTNFFDDQGKWFVQIQKIKNNYEIFVSVTKSGSNNPQDLEFFARLRNDMQALFPHNQIAFNLVVDSFDNVVKRIE